MIVALAVALGALSQSVSGFGFALVCGPALVATLGQAEGVRLALALSLLVNVAVLAREHAHVAWRTAAVLTVPAVLATPLFVLLLRQAPDRVAEAVAGTVAVAGAVALAVGVTWRAARGSAGAAGAGLIGAATNAAAGIGGPPLVLWADNAGWSGPQLRSTLQVNFLCVNVAGLLSLGLPHRPAGELAATVTALVVGLAVGSVVARRISARAARRTTLLLAAAGGLAVLVRAVAG